MVIPLLLIMIGCSNGTGISTVKKDNKVQKLRDYNIEQETLSPKRKVVIAEFRNQTRFGNRRLGSTLVDVMTTELVKSNRFIVLERADLSKVMQEINFSSKLGQGKLASERAFQDADYVITGAITKYAVNTVGNSGFISSSKTQRADVSFDMKMINVRTGEIVLSDQGEGTAEVKFGTTLGIGTTGGYDEGLEQDAFRAAAINVLDNIIKTVDKKPWQANIAKISGDSIYITSGQKSNLKIGTKLTVYQLGSQIVYNGKILGKEEHKVGVATVRDYIGDDASVLTYQGDSFTLPGIVKLEK